MVSLSTLSSTLLFVGTLVSADVYVHTACGRGSNNRLDEANRERNNANRMFDSQNNNRGGYNVGKMQCYQGEKVPIAWTNQHGSSKYGMEHTEFVIQYMCEPLVRDGTTTATIPDKPILCTNFDCDVDVRYGRHESYDYYERCKQTKRNEGLFTANQNLKGKSARYTRQNPNGNRHAYECPEERDYYPYWRATPWKDIAYVTNDIEKCEKIVEESQNVKGRGYCDLPAAFYATQTLNGNQLYPIDPVECADWTVSNGTTEFKGIWKEIPSWGLEKPQCIQAEQTRANHLGTIGGRTQYHLEWEIPADIPPQSRCVTRVRYNITTADYDAWETAASVGAGLTEAANAQKDKPNPNTDPANLDMWSKFGLTKEANLDENGKLNTQNSREYVFKNNPQVELIKPTANNGQTYLSDQVFKDEDGDDFRFKLQLAVNTAQFCRTFQDRTDVFKMAERPEEIEAEANINLITVTGKRGNIVQTFPAHEYFFFPDTTNVPVGQYVHWCWSGSNTNPNNNDGQGKQGTDRSNVVATRVHRYSKKAYSNFEWDAEWKELNSAPLQQYGETGDAGASYPAWVKQPEGYAIPTSTFGQEMGLGAVEGRPLLMTDNLLLGALGGASEEVLEDLATSRQAEDHDFGNMEELDDASTQVCMKPIKITSEGCWNYMSTRNHNFSNRDQKGKLCGTSGSVVNKMIGENGGEVWSTHGDGLMLPPGATDGVQNIRFESYKEDDTHVIMIAKLQVKNGEMFRGAIFYEPKALHTPVVMHKCTDAEDRCTRFEWTKIQDDRVDFSTVDGKNMATVWDDQGGLYKVEHEPNVAAIAGLTVGVLVFCCALMVVMYFRCRSTPGGGNNKTIEVM